MSEGYKKPFIPIWMEQARLTPRQYRVLGHLWSRGQGRCFPSLDTIAKCCGIRRGTVCDAIKALEKAGYVTRRKRKNKGVRNANEYVLTGPIGAPVKNEPGRLGHHLTGAEQAPPNRDTWSTGNDTPENDPPLNETPLFAGEFLSAAETIPSKKNPLQELVNIIWTNTPSKGRERSSKKQLEDALKKIPPKNTPGQAQIIAALEAWKVSELWIKDGGQYVPGVHRWVNDRKWESLPEPATPKQSSNINTGRRPSTIEET